MAINNVSQLRRDLIMVELGSPEDKAEILSKSLNYKLLEKGIEFCYSTSQVPTDQEMQKKFTDKQEKVG